MKESSRSLSCRSLSSSLLSRLFPMPMWCRSGLGSIALTTSPTPLQQCAEASSSLCCGGIAKGSLVLEGPHIGAAHMCRLPHPAVEDGNCWHSDITAVVLVAGSPAEQAANDDNVELVLTAELPAAQHKRSGSRQSIACAPVGEASTHIMQAMCAATLARNVAL